MLGAGVLGAISLLVLAGAGGAARPSAPLLGQIEDLAELAGAGLQQVVVTGHRFTADGDIFDAIDLRRSRTLLSFDSGAAQDRIEQLPWIQHAAVERIFPNRIEVRVTERTPFAVWRLGSRTFLIDRTGRVLGPVPQSAMPNLLRIVGEAAPGEAAALHDMLSGYPELQRQLETAERVGERRWTLHLTSGRVILLPAIGEARALAQVTKLTGTDFARIGEIDLRVPGRILVREWRGGGAQADRTVETRPTAGRI
ncbi:MAG: FtsQ-type POTRA domain-containing protein [Hyphomicrobiaceae bacterium]|nr:MAG: FtsQ-type POTRA domain-containing protein [Hyphomicrobiaceae bacterium]